MFGTGLGAQAGSGGTVSTGQVGPATAITWIPVPVPSPPPGDGKAAGGTSAPPSDWSVTVPSGPTAYNHVCSSMQPAWQSPQPTRMLTRNAPTPDAGATSYQLDWPIMPGSRGRMPVKSRLVGDHPGDRVGLRRHGTAGRRG